MAHRSIVAAGVVVPEKMDVPPHSLVAGVPAKIIKQLPPEQEQGLRAIAVSYYAFAEPHIESK